MRQNQRSIHLEMHKERSSKETNKVGGSYRGRVKRKKLNGEREREREDRGKERE